jgi:uncharacterized glyoxalase superfamily protein PhnB
MTQIVTPYLLYEDVAAALDWLDRAFGFREELRWAGEDGVVAHAEMRLGDGVIMLGHPGPDYESPRRTGHASVLIAVRVDDVDAHYERACAAGATIAEPPVDKPYGDRSYQAEDLEGHRWSFSTPVSAEVAPEDWGAVKAD